MPPFLSHARSHPYFQAGLLLLAALAIYAGSLSVPLVFDDGSFFDDPAYIDKFRHAYFSLELRWISYGSFSWMLDHVGSDLIWFRLVNVLLHAANAIILFAFLRRLFQVTLLDRETDALPASLSWLAFFGALIFTLHPVAVYGVAYLIQRSTVMATMFVLLMLLAYLEGLLRARALWLLFAALCYFAAVYSKEHSIAAPGVALALTCLIRKPSLPLLKQLAPYYALTTLIAGAVIWSTISIKGNLGSVYEPNAAGMLGEAAKVQGLTTLPNAHLLSILTQTTLFFKYLGLWLFPNPAWMSADMREPFATTLFSWPHTLGPIAFFSYFGVAVWLLCQRGRQGLLGFALLFPWIFFLSEGATVRVQEPFVLYRSYLWMPGLFAALPIVLGWKPLSKPHRMRPALIVLSCIAVLCIPLTLNRIHSFSSPLLLWDDAEKLVRDQPYVLGIERIYYNRGTEFGQLNQLQKAISDFSRSIEINPNIEFAYGNRATAYYFLGQYTYALRDYGRALSLNANNPNSYYGRALTHRKLGNFAAAQEDFRKSCALKGPCS